MADEKSMNELRSIDRERSKLFLRRRIRMRGEFEGD